MSYHQPSKLNDNGLIAFDFDMDDDEKLYKRLIDGVDHPAKKKTEEVAYKYLDRYLEKKGLTQKASINSAKPTTRGFVETKEYIDSLHHTEIIFKHLQTQELKITNTQLVKFRQSYKEVPVYGSLATVELDQKNNLIGISANFGQPNGTSPSPKISYAEAESLVREKGYDREYWEVNPKLHYYFDSSKEDWRLVYIIETKLKQKSFKEMSPTIPKLVDYIIDAHTKKVISELPRVRTLTSL